MIISFVINICILFTILLTSCQKQDSRAANDSQNVPPPKATVAANGNSILIPEPISNAQVVHVCELMADENKCLAYKKNAENVPRERSTSGLQPIHDLPLDQNANLKVQTYVGADEHNQTAVFFQIQNSYTNSIYCDINLKIKIKFLDNREEQISVPQPKRIVFPEAAFADRLVYKVDGDFLPPGAKLTNDNLLEVQQISASCSGGGPNRFLPETTCRILNSAHAQDCVYVIASGIDRYFLGSKNQFYLGICACN